MRSYQTKLFNVKISPTKKAGFYLKMMNNAFYFISKALFVLKVICYLQSEKI